GNSTSSSAACKANLKGLSLALMMYVQDYDNKMPPMRNQPQTQSMLLPYLKNKDLFACPESGLPYAMNARLSYVPVPWIVTPNTEIITFTDAKPHGDHWNVAYLS